MNTTEPKLLPLEQLVKLIIEHQEQVAKHQYLIREYEAQIREHLGQPKTLPVGNLRVSWTGPKRNFDTPRFMAMYPPEVNAHLYKTVPDNDAIPKSLKDQFMTTGNGEGTVKIK